MGNPKDITGHLVRRKDKRPIFEKTRRTTSNASDSQGERVAPDLFQVFTYSLIIICFVAQLFLLGWMDLF